MISLSNKDNGYYMVKSIGQALKEVKLSFGDVFNQLCDIG